MIGYAASRPHYWSMTVGSPLLHSLSSPVYPLFILSFFMAPFWAYIYHLASTCDYLPYLLWLPFFQYPIYTYHFQPTTLSCSYLDWLGVSCAYFPLYLPLTYYCRSVSLFTIGQYYTDNSAILTSIDWDVALFSTLIMLSLKFHFKAGHQQTGQTLLRDRQNSAAYFVLLV